jgi:hypothetical protein
MSVLPDPLVQSGNQDPAAPAAPVQPVEPVAPATPSTPLPDAEIQKAAELERKLQQYEADVRALKSTSDKRYSEAEKQWKQQNEQLKKELERIRMSSMDDDERKAYEAELSVERTRQTETELQKARLDAEEYRSTMQALSYFLHQGVPPSELVTDQGYDALFNSGMTWMAGQLKRLQTNPVTATPPPAQPGNPNSPLPTPPVVATSNQALPNLKPTWADLRQKYGSDERVYALVEAGILPRDIIPMG